MKRLALPLLAVLFGCASPDKKAMEVRQDLKKNGLERPEECVEKSTTMIQEFHREYGDPPRDDGDYMMGADVGYFYHARALCRKKLGQEAQAQSDLAKAVVLLNEFCTRARTRSRIKEVGRKHCEQAGESSELLARWKKGAKE
jgi:hypothetical protein